MCIYRNNFNIQFMNDFRFHKSSEIVPFPFPVLTSRIFCLYNSSKMSNSIISLIVKINVPVIKNIKSSIYKNIFNIKFMDDFIYRFHKNEEITKCVNFRIKSTSYGTRFKKIICLDIDSRQRIPETMIKFGN